MLLRYVIVTESGQQLCMECFLASSLNVTEHSSQQVLSEACNEGVSLTLQLFLVVRYQHNINADVH